MAVSCWLACGSASSLDFDCFGSIVPSLSVDNLANLKEGDGDDEREVDRCWLFGSDVIESDLNEEFTPSFGAAVCIEWETAD